MGQREATVVLRLTESDARWLMRYPLHDFMHCGMAPADRIVKEIKHALAECDCGEVPR
jgi:hypothetical protein